MPRVVFNRLLGAWYVVRGPHQTPISGRFDTRSQAVAWLASRQERMDFTARALSKTGCVSW